MLEKTNRTESLDRHQRVYRPENTNNLEQYPVAPSAQKKARNWNAEGAPEKLCRREVPVLTCEDSRQWEMEAQETIVQVLQPKQQAALAALLFRKGLLAQLAHSAASQEG